MQKEQHIIGADDWSTRLASAMASRPSRDRIEQTFAEQAHSFIQAKAGPLMDPQHLVGFEMIHSNDDNTRVIGAFAFRVDKSLWLAPVFFLGGQIRGDQFLYETRTRLFKPLCTEWANFIVKSAGGVEALGSPIMRQDMDRNSGMTYSIQNMMHAPHQYKMAALMDESTPRANWAESDVDEWFSTDTIPQPGALIRKFAAQADIKCVVAIQNLMTKYAEFADHMLELVDGDLNIYLQKDRMHEFGAATKVASAPESDSVLFKIHVGQVKQAATSEKSNTWLSKAVWNRGMELEEKRPDYARVRMIDPDVNMASPAPGRSVMLPLEGLEIELAAVFRPARLGESSLRGAGPTCAHSGTLAGTDFPANYNGGLRSEWETNDDSVMLYAPGLQLGRTVSPRSISCIEPKGEYESVEDIVAKHGEELPKVGKAYYVTTTSAQACTSQAYLVSKVDERSEGIVNVTMSPISRYSGGMDAVYIMQKSKSTDFARGILGGDVRFLPCSTEVKSKDDGNKCLPEFPDIMSGKSMFDHVVANNGLDIKVAHDPVNEVFNVTVRDSSGAETHKVDSFLKAASVLAVRAALHVDDAVSLVYEAEATGQSQRRVAAFEAIYDETKVASQGYGAPIMDLTQGFRDQQPNWQPHWDSLNNVMVDYPRSYEARVSRPVNGQPEMQVNEMVQSMFNPNARNSPGDGNPQIIPYDEMLGMGPDQIAQTLQQRNIPFAFEHGVVGQLVNTYDSGRMIREFLPDIDNAIDRLGRLLFLFLWKPNDFEKLYGSDELLQRETELAGNFRSLGMLSLNLRKKPADAQGASNPLV